MVRVYRGDPSAGLQVGADHAVAGLAAGSASSFSVTFDTTGLHGGQTFTVVVDADNQILEASEDDNARPYWVSLDERLQPDLGITLLDITFTPPRAGYGDPVDITARVHNLGEEPITDVLVAFYDGHPSTGTLLDTRVLPSIPARGNASTTVLDLTFTEGVHPIYVVVDEDDTIVEASELNNMAFKPLVVTQHVDLVVTNMDLTLSPSNIVIEGDPVQLHAVVQNTGTEPAIGVEVQLPFTGELVYLGNLDPGEHATAVFSLDTLGLFGFVDFLVVVDPQLQVLETNERNNVARATLEVHPLLDLFLDPISNAGVVRRGDSFNVRLDARNGGIEDARNVTAGIFDGDPAAGGKRLTPDLVFPLVPRDVLGYAGRDWRITVVPTEALSPGIHTLWVVIDPDDAFVESNEANNVRTFTVDVRSRPDLQVSATTTPSPAEEGDVVTIDATITNLAPNALFSAVASGPFQFVWWLRIYDGNEATGTLIAEKRMLGFDAADSYAISATFETEGRLGTNSITIIADPDRKIPEESTTNNRLVVNVEVSAATQPDLAITREDIVASPARFATGDTVTITATVHNDRDVAPSQDATVEFYLGDPGASGVPLGSAMVAVPANGSASAAINWDTTGLPPGDAGIWVVVDQEAAITERHEDNNVAARGFEVGLDDTHRPLALTATEASPNADLAWTAPSAPTDAIVRYYPLRDAALVALPVAATPRVTATASGGNPLVAIDPHGSTVWQVDATAGPQWIAVDLGDKVYLTHVRLDFLGAPRDFDVQAWDGAVWVTQLAVRGNNLSDTTMMPLPAPFKTDQVRVVLSRPGENQTTYRIATMTLQHADAPTTTAHVDAALLAATYDFAVTAARADGVESRPSDNANITITTVPAPEPLDALVSGNEVTLSWPADTSGRRTGVYVLRDGVHLELGAGDVEISDTATFTADPDHAPRHAGKLNDGSNTSRQEPPPESRPPWTIMATLPAPRPLSSLLINYQNLIARDVVIETWDGTAWVTQVALPQISTANTTVTFDAPVTTDRVRIVHRASSSGATPEVGELSIFARAPLPPATLAFSDLGVAPGNHLYQVIATDALGQDGAASATAVVEALPAPQNLTATTVGRDVELSWDALTEANVSGYHVARDGALINPADRTANLALSATPSASTQQSSAGAAIDGNNTSNWAPKSPTQFPQWLELSYAAPIVVSEVDLRHGWVGGSGSGTLDFSVEYFDGARWLAVVDVRNSPGGDFTYPLHAAVVAERFRLFIPRQSPTASILIRELRLFGPQLVTAAVLTDSALPDGTFEYRVAAVDDSGTPGPLSAPASATVGSLQPPTNLVASVDAAGLVSLSWSASAGAVGYHVYRSGVRITDTAVTGTSHQHQLTLTGDVAFTVTAVTTDPFETAPSAPAFVSYADVEPPSPPANLAFNGSTWQIRWDANPADEDVVGYHVDRADGPLVHTRYSTLQTSTLFAQDGPRFGPVTWTWHVIAVDVNGNESEPAVVSQTLPVPNAPVATATSTETTVSISYDASGVTGEPIGYALVRDGAFRTIVDYTTPTQFMTASSERRSRVNVFHDPYDYWESERNDPEPTLVLRDFYGLGDGTFVPVFNELDEIRVHWQSEAQMATSFVITAELVDGSLVDVVSVTGNTELTATYSVSPHVVWRSLTLRVTEVATPGAGVALRELRPRQVAHSTFNPRVDSEVPGGVHSYAFVTVDRGGQMSTPGTASVVDVAAVDLALALEDVRFSQDEVAAGDVVDVTISVRNLGTATVVGPADVELYLGDPGAGGTLLGSVQVENLVGGGRADFSFPYTVAFGDPALTAIVDRTDAIAERDESNNRVDRGPPLSLEYRTYTFAVGQIVVFGYEDATDIMIRQQDTGVPVYEGTIHRGTRAVVPVVRGVYAVSGSRKFSVYTGDYHVLAHYALDQNSRPASTELYTFLGRESQRDREHLITFALEDDTTVTVTDADTSEVLGTGTIDRGRRLHLKSLANGWETPRWVRVVADKPVEVLSNTDAGYTVPDARGEFTGTEFFTFMQAKTGTVGSEFPSGPGCMRPLLVTSLADNTFVRVTNSDTLTEIKSGVINDGEVFEVCSPNEVERFVTVQASNTVAVTHRPYAKGEYAGTAEDGFGADASGGQIGTLQRNFITPYSGQGTSPDKWGYVFAYYDDTVVTVRELARSDGSTPAGVIAKLVLDDGEYINVAKPLDVGGPQGFVPGRLVEIEASRPVSSRFGATGGALGEFSPLLFGEPYIPDLLVAATDIELSVPDPQPGDIFDVTVTVHNVGVQLAENFPVDIYAGDPAAGGFLLHREFVPALVGGDLLTIEIPYELSEGFHEIHVLADPEGVITELDESNNHAKRLLGTRADLQPTLVSTSPAAPLVNETVSAVMSITNDGGTHLARTDVQLFVGDPAAGGTEVASDTISLMAGETRELTFAWDTHGFPGGDHTLYVIADAADIVEEANEDNNVDSLDVTLTAPDYDDLRVASIIVEPASPFAGAPTIATVVVENRGRLISSTAVRLFVDGVAAADDSIPFALDTADVHAFIVPLTLSTPATVSVSATVDPDDLVAEADETNNSAAVPVTVRDPELQLVVAATPATAGPNADVDVSVTFTNLGAARDGQLELDILDPGGNVLASLAVGDAVSLGAAGGLALPFVWNTGTEHPGSYQAVARYLEAGELVAAGTAAIEVTPATPVTVLVNADKAGYATDDTAVIMTHVAGDPAGNDVIYDVEVLTEILAPDGTTVVFSTTQTIDVAPSSEHELFVSWDIGSAVPGIYTARSTVLGMSATDDVPVDASGPASVTLALSLAPTPITIGMTLSVTADVENVAPADLLGAVVDARLVDPVGGTVVATASQTHDLVSGVPLQAVFGFDTSTLTPDADYLAVVEVTHAGEPLALAFVPWTLLGDTDPPVVTITGVSDGQCSEPSVTPVISITDASSFSSTIELDGSAFVSGTPVTAEGTHVLTVHAQDVAGNVTDVSLSFAIDATDPVVSIVGVASGAVVQEATASLAVTEPNEVSRQFLLNGAAYAGTTIITEGSHTLSAEVTDCAGHVGTTSVTFAVDRTAPTIAVYDVTHGSLVNIDVTPVIAITDPHLATSSITLNGAPFTSGTTVSAEGAYELRVSADDAAGNVAAEVVVQFTIDKTAPAITVAGVTDGQASATALTPTFGATDLHLTSVTATLDGAPFTSGTSVSAEGNHSLVVTAHDGAGNSASTTVSFTIDATAPGITITGVTDGEVRAGNITPVVTFSDANLADSSITLDGAAFVSGTTITAEGDYVLAAEATDTAGNSASTTVSFAIDVTSPAIAITGVSDGLCTDDPVTPVISVTDAHLSSSSSTLNGAAFTSGTQVTADGSYSLAVDATDAASNASSETIDFTIDATAPVVTITGVTDGSFVPTAVTPVIDITDANLTSSTLTLDGAPFVSGTEVTAEGAHVLEVQATDCAGTTTTTAVSFTIDMTAPVVAVNGITDGEVRNTTATITVTTSDLTTVDLVITLDGAAFTSGSSVSAEGDHSLVATATDAAGNVTVRTVNFAIDLTPPAIALSGVTDGACADGAFTPTFTVDDLHLQTVTSTLDGNAFSSGTQITAEGSHTLVIDAADAAGNTAQVTATFIIDTTPPAIAVSGVADGTFYDAAVTPTVTITEANLTSSSLELDSAAFVSGTTVSGEGSHVLFASATDCAGHTTNETVNFTIDTQAPVITVTGVTDGAAYSAAVTPEISITDAHLASSSVTLNGAAFTSGTQVSTEGDHVLSATATDLAGHTTNVTVSFTIDATAPVVSITGVTDDACTEPPVTPLISITDTNLASSSITLNGSAFVSGTELTAEGSYALVADAADTAGNTTNASASFILDATAPVITVTGVTEGETINGAVVPDIDITETNLTSQTITLDGNAYTEGTVIDAPGSHTLAISATDCAGHQASLTINFEVVASDVVVGTATNARVLVGLETTTDAPILLATLANAGIPYTVTYSRTEWIAELRTGAYNVVVLYLPEAPEAGTGFYELRENVVAGTGLVVIEDQYDSPYKLFPAMGVYHVKTSTTATSVTLSGPLGDDTIPISGTVVHLGPDGASSAGASNEGDMAATTYERVNGASVVLGWDTELVDSTELRELYLTAIAYVTPTTFVPIPDGVVPLQGEFTAGPAGNYRLDLDLDTGMSFLWGSPAPDTAGVPQWSVTLAASAVFGVDTLVRLPATVGTHEVTVEHSYETGGTYNIVGAATQGFTIDRDAITRVDDLMDSLDALSLSGADATRRDYAVAYLYTVRNTTDPATNIDELLSVNQFIDDIESVDVSAQHNEAALLLRIWQARSVIE